MIAFDTNVLVYAAEGGSSHRHVESYRIINSARATGRVVLLLQSLVEFYHAGTRKLRIPPSTARDFIDAWRAAAPVHAYTEADLMVAIDAVAAHRLAFFDALLWATAARVGVTHLVTEDQQHGRRLGGVTWLSPFDPATPGLLGLD
jgi:predicted nucleic acid-binding protein